MAEPCRSCSHRAEDFGGCRCQAYALTGDAARTDPACALSPDHGLIRTLTGPAAAAEPPLAGYTYRRDGRGADERGMEEPRIAGSGIAEPVIAPERLATCLSVLAELDRLPVDHPDAITVRRATSRIYRTVNQRRRQERRGAQTANAKEGTAG